jgi:5-methylcytosine-specific restriction endonuclease McrA
MPSTPPRPCSNNFCNNLVTSDKPCPTHKVTAWQGSTRRERLPNQWHNIRKAILKRDKNVCYVCGKFGNEVDHIIPGDNHSNDNLATICTKCHRSKSGREGGSKKRY